MMNQTLLNLYETSYAEKKPDLLALAQTKISPPFPDQQRRLLLRVQVILRSMEYTAWENLWRHLPQ